jgi:D-alanine transaminase
MKKDPIVFFNGKYIPKSEVSISPDDRGFLFADGVYEVFRYYFKKFFLFSNHIKRLEYSLQELQINFRNLNQIEEISRKLLKLNNLDESDAIVYIQITRGVFKRMHQFPPKEIEPTIYMTASPTNYFPEQIENGVKVITTSDNRGSRCDIKSVALLANILAQQKAKDENAVEVILVKDGLVTEGSHTGVFGVKDEKILTHPGDNKVLPSITRELIFQLALELKINVKEIPIYENQLSSMDEFFIVGTSSEITPVIQINNNLVGDGKPGPITRKLQKAFHKLTHT